MFKNLFLIKLLKYIFLTKKVFKKPAKKKILIYDKAKTEWLNYENSYFNFVKKNASILCVRGEEINLYVLIKTILRDLNLILNFRLFWRFYKYNYIQEVNPKIIMTFIDNDTFFYTIKNQFSKAKIISIQNGYRFLKGDIFGELKKRQNKNTYKCDYIFCFGRSVGLKYRKYFNSRVIFHGSFPNNLVPLKKFNISKKYCLFVSSYGLGNSNAEKKIIPVLHKFCIKKNINLFILMRSPKRVEAENEKNFFSSFNISKNIKLISRQSDFRKTYDIINKSDLVVYTNSTLGYESLARQKKTVCFNLKDRNLNCSSYLKFGWPEENNKNGFFWLTEFSTKKANRILERVYESNKNIWLKISKKYLINIMRYDYKNSKFKKLIKQLL